MRATLTYHSIDPTGSAISVRPQAFEEHLVWLSSGRVRTLALDDLVSDPAATHDAVAVVFDDGFANIFEPARRLRDHGIPVTIFVVSGHVGRTNSWGGRTHPSVPTLPLLSWDDLEVLLGLGVEVAAHTRTHAALSALDTAAIDDEFAGCQDDLRVRLGVSPAHMAYPYGDVTPGVAARAHRFFRYGHTTAFGTLGRADDPLRLPRLDLYYLQQAGALSDFGARPFQAAITRVGMRRLARHLLSGLPAPGHPRRWTR